MGDPKGADVKPPRGFLYSSGRFFVDLGLQSNILMENPHLVGMPRGHPFPPLFSLDN